MKFFTNEVAIQLYVYALMKNRISDNIMADRLSQWIGTGKIEVTKSSFSNLVSQASSATTRLMDLSLIGR